MKWTGQKGSKFVSTKAVEQTYLQNYLHISYSQKGKDTPLQPKWGNFTNCNHMPARVSQLSSSEDYWKSQLRRFKIIRLGWVMQVQTCRRK